jgi:hypothetical protein
VARLALTVIAALVFAAPAWAGGPTLLVGAAEDAVKQPDIVSARAQLDLARLAGLDTVRPTVNWLPGQTEPTVRERQALEALAGAARLTGTRIAIAVFHPGSRTTPLTEEARGEFARFTASLARISTSFRLFIIGNEPNLNRFWLPQFGPDGSSVSAAAYLELLAETYDALKAVSPSIQVAGGALSPRGSDRPEGIRPTHSPTKFLRDLGTAYRASGRTLPVMDQLAIHPYGDTNRQSPRASAHPTTTSIGLADYDKLVKLLGEAFDGTPQPGSALPILYAEYGVQTTVPQRKASIYTGREPATTAGVAEATQAAFYRQAIELAFCQPNVRGIFFLHTADEPDLDRWQSGVFYADGSPKSSLPALAGGAVASRRGIVARCEGLELTPVARRLRPMSRIQSREKRLRFQLDTDIDSHVAARLERLPDGGTVLTMTGRSIGRTLASYSFPRRPTLAPGTYRVTVELTATVNRGAPGIRSSVGFRVTK